MKRRAFTFLEILAAVAILGMSLGMVLSMVGSARGRVIRAERRWARAHVISQAAEFFLLAGPGASVPDFLLPEGFSATCAVMAIEDLPEMATEAIGGFVLARYEIAVYGPGGDLVGERMVEKLVVEEDLY